MAVIRNVNPLGQVDLPLIYRQGEPLDTHGVGCLEPGEEFTVSAEHAAILLGQSANYEPVDAEAVAIDAEIPSSAFRHVAPAKASKPGSGTATSHNTDGE